MSKSIKVLLSSILVISSLSTFGCSKEIKETDNNVTSFDEVMNNGNIEEIKEYLTKFFDDLNNGAYGDVPYASIFKINENEVRVCSMAKSEKYKAVNKEGIKNLYETIYNLISNKGYEGKIISDIGYYNKTDNEYIIYYTCYYDTNGDFKINPVKKVYSKSELFDYYN